jgi:hypothetical protein
MFSPMRMVRCQSSFTIDNAPANLGTTFHEAWLEVVERGRLAVIEKMGRKLCADHPGKAVTVSLQCTYLDRPAASFGGFDVCRRPLL